MIGSRYSGNNNDLDLHIVLRLDQDLLTLSTMYFIVSTILKLAHGKESRR